MMTGLEYKRNLKKLFEAEKAQGKSSKTKKLEDEVNQGSDSSGTKDSDSDSDDKSNSTPSSD